MKVVVMFPTAIEAEAFDGTLCDVVVCGVGGAECGAATARVVSEKHPDIVVLAGVAGTYSSRYEVGQTVAVCSEVVADMANALLRCFKRSIWQPTPPKDMMRCVAIRLMAVVHPMWRPMVSMSKIWRAQHFLQPHKLWAFARCNCVPYPIE